MPKPDFSGTWKFNAAKSLLQIPSPDSTLFVMDHREPRLRISRTHIVGEKRDQFSLDLTTDGQHVSVVREGVHLDACAYWDGDVLVFDTRLVRAGDEATNLVRYTLSPDGQSFKAEERFRSATLNYDNIWIMEKHRHDGARNGEGR